MDTSSILSNARDRMKKALEVTTQDVSSIRSGRATPSLVENIVVTTYEGTQRLKVMELATITTMDTRTIVIAPFDPSTLSDIEKGIQEANIGLTPVIDGEMIRITIPSLTQERREEYIKLAKTKIEAGRIMIRQVRQDAMHALKKEESEKTITEDDKTYGEKKVQELTDEMIGEMDNLGERKEQELLQV